MGCSRGVPGCSRGVPGMFRGVPGMFWGVPGCSGFNRHPKCIIIIMIYTYLSKNVLFLAMLLDLYKYT